MNYVCLTITAVLLPAGGIKNRLKAFLPPAGSPSFTQCNYPTPKSYD